MKNQQRVGKRINNDNNRLNMGLGEEGDQRHTDRHRAKKMPSLIFAKSAQKKFMMACVVFFVVILSVVDANTYKIRRGVGLGSSLVLPREAGPQARREGESGYRSLVKREGEEIEKREGEEVGNAYRSLVKRETSETSSKAVTSQTEGGGGNEGKTEGSSTVKKDSAGAANMTKVSPLAPGMAPQQKDATGAGGGKEGGEKNDKEGKGDVVTASPSHTTTGNKDKTHTTDSKAIGMDGDSDEPVDGPSGLSPDAMLRGFYVFIGIGTIVLIYIAIKFVRLRRRRAPQKYGLLSHMEDQEMFPLAADDGDDEEIYNATDHHHTLK